MRHIIPPHLMREHSQQVQRIGLARLRRPHLPVERLRLRQPPGLVVAEREFKGLLDVHVWKMPEPMAAPNFRSKGRAHG